MENEMLAMTIFAALASAASDVSGTPLFRRDVEVSLADLDLTNGRHVEELDRRLKRAAWEACGPVHGTDPLTWALAKECQEDALRRARSAARARISKS